LGPVVDILTKTRETDKETNVKPENNKLIHNNCCYKMTQSMKTRQVSFHQVELIELPYCLGDNTACSHGAPISVEWQAQKRTSFDVSFFEEYRPKRRSCRMLLLSGSDREEM
jgi:hypothetical protein